MLEITTEDHLPGITTACIRVKYISPRGHWHVKLYPHGTKLEFNNREYIAKLNGVIIKPVSEYADD